MPFSLLGKLKTKRLKAIYSDLLRKHRENRKKLIMDRVTEAEKVMTGMRWCFCDRHGCSVWRNWMETCKDIRKLRRTLCLLIFSKWAQPNIKHVVLVLQPIGWRCVECAIHHERDVREEQRHIYVARTSNNRVISSGDPYCCLLPQCEALRTCRSGFPIATLYLI